METKQKESIVSRLFGFGKKKEEPLPEGAAPEETGFARTGTAPEPEDAGVTIPEQVIRVRGNKKEEAIGAISDSFKELTRLLGSVGDRLDRQDSRTADLSDQLRELPEYLRTLPRVHQEQTDALLDIGSHLASHAEAARAAGQEQAFALRQLGEKLSEGTGAVQGMADAMARLPEEIRSQAAAQEEALRQIATAHKQTAKVVYAGQQKSLQLFQLATQKTIRNIERQREDMQVILDSSISNMKRMFILAAAFMGAALLATGALLYFQ
jgi:chromosome segregation ATPase